jgi:hypothetical protein
MFICLHFGNFGQFLSSYKYSFFFSLTLMGVKRMAGTGGRCEAFLFSITKRDRGAKYDGLFFRSLPQGE